MAIKISIIIPNENINDVDLLEPLVSDIGDNLVKYGLGNEITEANPEEMEVDSLISYIFITEDITVLEENMDNMLFVIPISETKNE